MLLTITLTGPDASGLGFLLHKHPDRVQSFDLPVGRATVFYPEAEPERVTAALLVEVDPVGLVRGRRREALREGHGASLAEYVTDRPYAASSMLSVALGRVFNTALNGRCTARPDLAETALPLSLSVPAIPVRGAGDAGGAALVRRLLEPLGWTVAATQAAFPEDLGWGDAPYVDLVLTGTQRLADALAHLYVLLPVLDNAKHYWVSSDEVDKLIRRGEGWLATHPDRELITRRYLGMRRSYVADATARLDELDDRVPDETPSPDEEPQVERPTPLKVHRLQTVLGVLAEVGARRVADVGCGEGFYLRALLDDPAFTEVVGVDVSARELAVAEQRLHLERRSDHQRSRIALRQSSVTYRDASLSGFDAILLIEVIEHVEPDRLASLAANVFGAARPAHVVVTTPNVEYNAHYGMPDGSRRHRDHRFEWTRAQFSDWATEVAGEQGYRVEFRPVGEPDADLGPPTQLALFTREGDA